ncbi:Zn(2)-C6 fungal-type domain-containing protein [Fusarium keratoplasticum]|uniref:Zn(2)-C6 fungal-type domain-containing protein n=1 Tax=Fusarium keratoplasticum TaxID=1328300 RepID=A0ACC0RCL0_9HYPO|nr:Zn(2)-C6 fungal-type domain-containing protein [Fusarium keratoplasticum]KAI8680523.1 Zn(2)-C6 fungal-type domain-containing protein [Fusarium keratoplasticum]
MDAPQHGIAKRRNRACDECARRRYCDVPSFTGTGDTLDVHGEARQPLRVLPRGTDQPADPDVALLYERIAHLEEQLARLQKRPSTTPVEPTYPPVVGVTFDIEELDYSMEHLNLGLASNDNDPEDETTLFSYLDCHLLRFSLPSRITSTRVVRFVLDQLGWLHCALNASEFEAEHEKFWDLLESQSPYQQEPGASFSCVYLAILSVSFYYMDISHEAVQNFAFYNTEGSTLPVPKTDEDLAILSRHWYWAVLQSLEDSDFLGKPRLSTVQTIAILTLVNSSFGQNDREWMLIGIAVNIARILNMHRLANEQTLAKRISALPQWRSLAQRNLGRRLWWTLVICDWMGVMSNRPTIPQNSFDTVLDVESGADDIMTCEVTSISNEAFSDLPSSLSYHQLMANLAGVIRIYVKSGRSYAPQNLITAMHEVEKLQSQFPEWPLSSGESSDNIEATFPWIPLQQYFALHAIQFMRLTIARFFFTRWMKRQPDPEGLHMKACKAAEIIVAQKRQSVPTIYRRNWIVCAATVAAGVFLCLDLLFFSTGEDITQIRRRRKSVQICIDALQEMGSTNVVSSRGSAVLDALLKIHLSWSNTAVPDHESLRHVIAQVHQAQALAPEAITQWERPRKFLHPQPNFYGPMETTPSWNPTVSPQYGQLGLSTSAPLSKVTAEGTELGTESQKGADSDMQYAWDYLMSASTPHPTTSRTDNSELEELEDFDNPFQFDETMQDMMYLSNKSSR